MNPRILETIAVIAAQNGKRYDDAQTCQRCGFDECYPCISGHDCGMNWCPICERHVKYE